MDLRTYLSGLLRNWWIILSSALVGLAGAVGWYLAIPPTFGAAVEFYVSSPVSASSNPQAASQFAESRVQSYIILLNSQQLASRVINETGVDLSPVAVSGSIASTSEIGTVIIRTTVTSTDSAQALTIAKGVATVFPVMVDELDNQGRGTDVVSISVISGPSLLPAPVAPNKRNLLILGIGGGLLIGLFIAILRELLNATVRTEQDAEDIVGRPVLGVINYDPEARQAPLLIQEQTTTRRAEAFRQLRTNVQFIGAAQDATVLLLTSSVAMEGKTTTAINLALSFVELGERVLLIDADLRRPRISAYLDLPNDVGLTDIFTEKASLEQAIQVWSDTSLSVLSSGRLPPNPSELLGSPRMTDQLSEMRPHYDRIILDSPPVLPVADAAVLAQVVDGVVFVIRDGKTSRTQVRSATRALTSIGAPLVGSILNMKRVSKRNRLRSGMDSYYGAKSPSI